MNLYKEWKNTIENNSLNEQQQHDFWNDFCLQEQGIYKIILGNKQNVIKGKIKELAPEYDVSTIYFMGFLDGINESISNAQNLEDLKEESEINIEIDFKKLYYNMLAVPAEWLYTLPQWNSILSQEEMKNIKKEYNNTKTIVNDKKIGRNESCPCGSGKKYKKCCGR